MAENKKAFVLYSDLKYTTDHLSNEDAGKVFKWVLDYVNDLDPEPLNGLLAAVCEPIKQTLKRDLKKYERRANNSRNNGKLGGRPPNEKNPKKPSGLIDNPDEPKKPDSVSVSVSVSDSVSDSVSVINTKPKPKRYAKDVTDTVQNCMKYFPEHLQPKTAAQKIKWCDVVDKLHRIDSVPYKDIEEVTIWARKDEFWSSVFLSLPKLRKKNDDGIAFIVVFNEKLKRNGKKQPVNKEQQQAQHMRSVQNIIKRREEDRRRAKLSDDSPKPDVIVMAYGTIAQGLSAFNVKNPMTPEQIELFVEDFIEDYKHESIADLKICLKNARNGVYGTHYQAIDQLTVMEWFGKYLDEKAMERERLHTRLKNKTMDSVSDQVYPALKDAVENIGKKDKNGIKRK